MSTLDMSAVGQRKTEILVPVNAPATLLTTVVHQKLWEGYELVDLFEGGGIYATWIVCRFEIPGES